MTGSRRSFALALVFASLLVVALMTGSLGLGCVIGGGLSPVSTEPLPNDPRVKAVAEKLQPSVVGIRAMSGDGVFTQEIGLGTGIVLRKDGLVVTNDHVITLGGQAPGDQPAPEIQVELPNGKRVKAVVAARSPGNDLAFLRIDATGLVPAVLASSLADVKKGNLVVAIGKGPTLTRPVTAGKIIAVLRNVHTPSLRGVTTLISSSAPVTQGNSGGPLADAQGTVIGVNAAATFLGDDRGASTTGPNGAPDYSGTALSIPAPTVLQTMRQLLGG